MVKESDVTWFKREFGAKITAAVKGTPLTLDHIAAIALQETGYIWARLQRKGLSTARVLELCVGDTIDKNRKAFPKNKAALLAEKDGDKMFAIARQGLVEMAEHFADTPLGEVAKNPDKFCHGFGIFQYDLQFFLENPKYFLERQYANFDIALARCMGELKRGLQTVGVANKPSLTDEEAAHVAIAYNTGGFNPAKGLKQGHESDGKFYGESYLEWLKLAHKAPAQ